jgi:hypothetical protein
MVNNATNIKITNHHLSPKESLNSDGQQFHQFPKGEVMVRFVNIGGIVNHHCLSFL